MRDPNFKLLLALDVADAFDVSRQARKPGASRTERSAALLKAIKRLDHYQGAKAPITQLMQMDYAYALLYAAADDYSKAIAHLDGALRLARNDRLAMSYLLTLMGEMLHRQGLIRPAHDTYFRALNLIRDHDDASHTAYGPADPHACPGEEFDLLNRVAGLAMEMARYDELNDLVPQAHRLFDVVGAELPQLKTRLVWVKAQWDRQLGGVREGFEGTANVIERLHTSPTMSQNRAYILHAESAIEMAAQPKQTRGSSQQYIERAKDALKLAKEYAVKEEDRTGVGLATLVGCCVDYHERVLNGQGANLRDSEKVVDAAERTSDNARIGKAYTLLGHEQALAGMREDALLSFRFAENRLTRHGFNAIAEEPRLARLRIEYYADY